MFLLSVFSWRIQTLKKENVGGRDGEKRLAVNGPKSLPWKRLEPPANSVCCDVGLGGWQACPRPLPAWEQ